MSEMVQMTLKVDGMACGMCEAHINDAIRSHFAVKKVSSSHTKGETVIVSEQPVDVEEPLGEERLRAVIAETGYELKSVTTAPCEEKHGLGGLFQRK